MSVNHLCPCCVSATPCCRRATRGRQGRQAEVRASRTGERPGGRTRPQGRSGRVGPGRGAGAAQMVCVATRKRSRSAQSLLRRPWDILTSLGRGLCGDQRVRGARPCARPSAETVYTKRGPVARGRGRGSVFRRDGSPVEIQPQARSRPSPGLAAPVPCRGRSRHARRLPCPRKWPGIAWRRPHSLFWAGAVGTH